MSDLLCRHIATARWETLPDLAREGARSVALDAIGVIHAASGLAPEAAPFIALARANGAGPCAIIGTQHRVQPIGAALANGALAHAVDYEDAFDRAPAHPNASLVPVLLALAQSEGPVDGRRFLTALAVGGDVACRIALSLRQPMEQGGWYPPPIVAAFGAVAGAANLLGLSPQQTRDALSLTLCQVTMPGEIKHSRRTTLRAVREAFPAQAALTSVLLAREGVPGFEEPLEGKSAFFALYAGGQFDPADLTDGLGVHYWGGELTFKPWPSCRGTHPFIEMALDLSARHGIAPSVIERVEVSVDGIQSMLVDPLARKQAPETAIDAKFSVPFTTALALVRGAVRLEDFDAASLADPEVLAMAARIQPLLEHRPEWQPGVGGAMRIMLTNGESRHAWLKNALGCPTRPLPPSAQRAKFVDCVDRAASPLKPDAADRLADAILGLDLLDDVGALFQPTG
ncbi:MmgE/PrpD family protein [Novosphingobium taihuense]|uniref:2-methylcitrate dehydratase PrpD n=1 Tax=Novosphingobium taihuense TaxID=260085 RepID=A0A7W7EV02_9SPHN|nr:MmgE/PrpD family protein [Novosphingobium taihuense]MBB4614942.1 2-methylcitrate dehydratase PrpD [Novosphingobium taihuense]